MADKAAAALSQMSEQEIATKLESIRADEASWRERAKRALGMRSPPSSMSRFDAFCYNYNAKYIRTGRWAWLRR